MNMHPTKIIAVSTFALTLLLSSPVKGMNGADAILPDFRELLVQANKVNAEDIRDAAVANIDSLANLEALLRDDRTEWTLVNLQRLDKLIAQVGSLIANLKGSQSTKYIHKLSKTRFFVDAQTVLADARGTRAMVWNGITPEMRLSHTVDNFVSQLAVLRSLKPEVNLEHYRALEIIAELRAALQIIASDENIPLASKNALRDELIAMHTRFTRN